MLLLKKYEKSIRTILFVMMIPIMIPFLSDLINLVLKAGRIVGTFIRIF